MTRDQLKQLETDLWSAADNLRANSDLKSSEYATPVLGLIFLKFADNNYRRHEVDIIAEFKKLKGTRREKKLSDIAIEKCGFYPPDGKSRSWVSWCALNTDTRRAPSRKVTEEFGRGFSNRNLDYMRRFFLDYSDRLPRIVQKPSAQLTAGGIFQSPTEKLGATFSSTGGAWAT